MIKAKLIIGGTQAKRIDLAQKTIEEKLGRLDHPDLISPEESPSTTIKQIREIKKRLSLKPYQASLKIVLFPEAEKITLPAQNALLKTLEEPPGEALIILLAPKKEALLPTIVSRCQIAGLSDKSTIQVDQSTISYQLSAINNTLGSSAGERLIIADGYSQNRQQAIDFCQQQLAAWREILRKGAPTPRQTTQTLRQILQAINYLEANVNPKLVIENLLLSYPA